MHKPFGTSPIERHDPFIWIKSKDFSPARGHAAAPPMSSFGSMRA
jgi:hypothetical protein